MRILHIAAVTEDVCSGVSVVIPQMLQSQREYAEVELLNIVLVNDKKTQDDRNSEATTSYENNGNNEATRSYEVNRNSKDYKVYSLADWKAGIIELTSYNLVVFHEPYEKELPFLAKQVRRAGVPYLLVPHGELTLDAQRKKWLKKKVANRLLFGSYIEHAAALHCLSKREYENTFFGKEKFVIANGVNPAKRKKEAFHEDGIDFIYVGRLEIGMKGIDLLLDACGIIKEELQKAKASVSLYGPVELEDKRRLTSLIQRNGLEHVVSLHAAITGEEKTEKLLSSDVFIQTSRFEGMPLGVLEALSLGLPCVVTEGTYLADTVSKADAGWGVETNAEAIARGMKGAIEEKKKYKDKSEHAVQLIEENFLWKSIARQTIEKYKKYAK